MSHAILRRLAVFVVLACTAYGLHAQRTLYTSTGTTTQTWNNALTWTLSPSGGGFAGAAGTPGRYTGNPGGDPTDRVVILAGQAIFANVGAIEIADIFVQEGATLYIFDSTDVSGGQYEAATPTTGHLFENIRGGGRIVLVPGGGNYTLPSSSGTSTSGGALDFGTLAGRTAAWDEFLDAADGGTLVFAGGDVGGTGEDGIIPDIALTEENVTWYENNTGGALAGAQTVNNVLVYNNVEFAGRGNRRWDAVTAGNVSVKFDGTFEILDEATFATTEQMDVIYSVGNVTINTANTRAGGAVDVEVGSNTWVCEGDFTINDGEIDFGNTDDDLGEDCVVVFVNNEEDQDLRIEDTAFFSMVGINKGLNQTSYRLNISASAGGLFTLGGPNQAQPSNADVNMIRAGGDLRRMALNTGTVAIGANIDFNTGGGGNYNINEDARLLVDGGSYTHAANMALYGTIEITAGSISVPSDRALTIRQNGGVTIRGGTVSVEQIGYSTVGGTHRGAFIMTGGVLNLEGDPGGANRSRLTLSFSTNIFQMSGGTINVFSTNSVSGTSRAIDIRCSEENISVTGGTLNLIIDNGQNIGISSSAPFYNVNITNPSNLAGLVELVAIVADGDADAGGPDPDDAPANQARPLVVLNDLTIGQNADLDANGEDVSVGRDFTFGLGATYQGDNNTTRLIGSLNGAINLQLATTFDGGLSVEKDASDDTITVVTPLVGPGSTALTIEDDLSVTRGVLDYDVYDVVVNGNVTNEEIIGTTTSTGALVVRRTLADQTIDVPTGDVAQFGNVVIDATGGTTSLEGGNAYITGDIAVTNGVFDINTHTLTVDGEVWSDEAYTTQAFSIANHIRTNGNPSDGGLRLQIDGNQTYIYPIGTDANATSRYTPVSAVITGFSDAGYLSFNLLDYTAGNALPTLANTTALSYAFRSRVSDFTAAPNAVYNFTYDNSDEDAQTITGWVPGAVEFATRRAEDAADFNGAGDAFQIDDTGTTTATDADYTAGDPTAFAGFVRIFYSRANGSALNTGNSGLYNNDNVPNTSYDNQGRGTRWGDTDMWRVDLDGPGGVDHATGGTGTGLTPTAGDIVIIGAGHRVWAGDNGGNETAIFAASVELGAAVIPPLGSNEDGGSLLLRDEGGAGTSVVLENSIIGEITGGGVLYIDVQPGSPQALPDADYGSFVNTTTSVWIYRLWNGNGSYTLSSSVTEYPSLHFLANAGNSYNLFDGDADDVLRQFEFPAVDLQVNQNLLGTAGVTILMSDGAAGDINVEGMFQLGVEQNVSPIQNGAQDQTAKLRFPNTGSNARTLSVDGDVYLAFVERTTDRTAIEVEAGGTTRNVHRLRTGGSITLVDDSQILGLNAGTNDSQLEIEFFNPGNVTFDKIDGAAGATTPTATPLFYRLIVNKDMVTDTVSMDFDFTLSEETTLTENASNAGKPLQLATGTLNLNSSGIDILWAEGGADVLIPEGANLVIGAGADVRVENTGTNDTGLELSGGLYLEDSGIPANPSTFSLIAPDANRASRLEYSATGTATVSLEDNTELTVGGQIRRSALAEAGVLRWYQTGGTAYLGGELTGNVNTYTDSRGVFEIDNNSPGNLIQMSGGTIIVRNEVPGDIIPEVYLNPDASLSDITGGTIQLGESGVSNAGNTIRLYSAIPIFNLTIDDVAAAFDSEISTDNLVVEGTFTITGANSSFAAQAFDIDVYGDVNVTDGALDVSQSTMSLVGGVAQSISLTDPTSVEFMDLFIGNNSDATVLQLGTPVDPVFEVTNGLTIEDGSTLAIGSNNILLSGFVQNDGEQTATTGVLEFNNAASAVPQNVLGDNTAVFGNFLISDDSGINVLTDLTVTGDIEFGVDNGIMDINGQTLTMPAAATFTGDNAATDRYVITSGNGAGGIVKSFNTGAVAFTYPLGVDDGGSPLYAGAVLTGTVTTAGSYTIRPVNQQATSTTDPNNETELNFYWEGQGSGIVMSATGFSLVYSYNDSDVEGTEANYRIGYLIDGFFSWEPAVANPPTLADLQALVDDVANTLTFDTESVISENAIFTAGEDFELGAIGRFRTRLTYTGNFTNPVTTLVEPQDVGDVNIGANYINAEAWQILLDDGDPDRDAAFIASGAEAEDIGDSSWVNVIALPLARQLPPDPSVNPTGGAGLVTIRPGTMAYVNTLNNEAFNITIEDDGTEGVLEIQSGSFGNVLTSIDGAGRLRIVRNTGGVANVPDADYTNFVSATGGTFEFSGSGSYSLPGLSTLATYNDLEVSGTGTKTLTTAQTTTVLGDFTLDGTTAVTFNTSATAGSRLLLFGDLITTGTNGSLAGTGAIAFRGSTDQTIDGDFTGTRALRNVNLNKPGGQLLINNPTNSRLDIDGTLTWLQNLIIVPGTNTIRFLDDGAASGFNANRFIRGDGVTATVEKEFTAANAGSGFQFPLGEGGAYGRIDIISIDNIVGSEIVSALYVFDTPLGSSELGTGVTSIDGNQYWVVDGPVGSNIDVRLHWNFQIADGVTTTSNDIVVLATNSAPATAGDPWESLGGVNPLGDVTTTGSVESDNLASFASPVYLTFGSETTPLPVDLIEFTGKWVGQQVQLDWVTASELNNDGFWLERSTNGGASFNTIAWIPGNGTTEQLNYYTDMDGDAPQVRSILYRLTQQDLDGTQNILPAIEVLRDGANPFDEGQSPWRVFPNPTLGDDLNITILDDRISSTQDDIFIRVVNAQGSLIYANKAPVAQQLQNIRNAVAQQPNGLYLLQLQIEGHSESIKLLKQ